MSTNQKGHPHAESMLLYAQDAMETNKPWERWECKDSVEGWSSLTDHPMWGLYLIYRRKPQTILVNGIEVPEPVRTSLEKYEQYWVAAPSAESFALQVRWLGDNADFRLLHSGLIHMTKEAAVLHSKAMLKPSRNNP